jgi:hypothetical protein
MTIAVDFHDDGDKSTICWTFDGRWDWNQLLSAHKFTVEQTQSMDRVDMMFDVRQMGLVPKDVASGLRKLRSLDRSYRGNGINVIVGADYYLKLLWEFLAADLPAHWASYFADDIDQALNIIHEARESAPVGAYAPEFAQASVS